MSEKNYYCSRVSVGIYTRFFRTSFAFGLLKAERARVIKICKFCRNHGERGIGLRVMYCYMDFAR